jgi:hypothetical protein
MRQGYNIHCTNCNVILQLADHEIQNIKRMNSSCLLTTLQQALVPLKEDLWRLSTLLITCKVS